jgi:hypothetical protein
LQKYNKKTYKTIAFFNIFLTVFQNSLKELQEQVQVNQENRITKKSL